MTAYTPATWNDAGLLREYLADRYGADFCSGGGFVGQGRAMRLAVRLCNLSMVPLAEIIEAIKADYEAEAKAGR